MKNNYWQDRVTEYEIVSFVTKETNKPLYSERVVIRKITGTEWVVCYCNNSFLSRSAINEFLTDENIREQSKDCFYYFEYASSPSNRNDEFRNNCYFNSKEEALANFLLVKDHYINIIKNQCQVELKVID